MARLSPEQQIARILKTIRAWETYAPRDTFTGHTLAQFKAAMQPSLDAHARVANLRQELRTLILMRNDIVWKAMRLIYRIGHSTKGSADHGPNSDLSEALGYTREAVRRSKIRRTKRRKR
jgi:hypothetical protein